MSLPNSNKINELLHIFPNPDGTVTRPAELFPTVPPSTTDSSSPSLSKDVPLNSEKNTWVRIFIPRESLNSTSKLPILVYIHGSGFVVASPDFHPFHDFCSYAACHLGVLVISVKYRLAPEHRLPAAYDDVLEALTWVKDGQDEWIIEYGDMSSCVLMGESAGGNIAYHAGLRVAAHVNDYKPLNIRGLVLIQPFFSGLERSSSELRSANNPVVILEALDMCWELSLPVGMDRSHEYCDPIVGGGSRLLDEVRDLGWWVAVVSCDGDPLYDRNVEFSRLLEQKGIRVRSLLQEGGQHGMFVGVPGKRKGFLDFVMGVWP